MILDSNISKLDPAWQSIVTNICREIELSGDKYLDSMTVFGSVARSEANSASDLDICLDYSCDIMDEDYVIDTNVVGAADIIRKNTNGNSDTLYKPLISGRLLDSIEKDGIVVYQKG